MAEIITPLTAGGPQLRPPEPINRLHDVSAFSSRSDELNYWLKRHALRNEQRTARTYVVAHGSRVVGYYSLATGSVRRLDLPHRIQRNTPPEIPVVVLGRLATDQVYEGRGIGSGMLAEAVMRTLNFSVEIGTRALIVHAINEDAIRFYRKYEFMPSPLSERTLVLPTETARQVFQE